MLIERVVVNVFKQNEYRDGKNTEFNACMGISMLTFNGREKIVLDRSEFSDCNFGKVLLRE